MARQAKTILSGALQLAVMANVLAAKPVRDVAVIKSKRPPKGAPVLTVAQLRNLLAGLRTSDYCREYDLADPFTLLIATGLRRGELLGLRWSDIDFEARHLTIPPERMKGGREFRVPLTDSALAIIEKLRAVRTGNPHVFNPGIGNKPMPEGGMRNLLRRLRPDVTVHGTIRSTFSTWCSEETSYPVDLREACLAHQTDDKTAEAYNRGDKLQRRRALLTAWERFCLTPPDSNVARLPRAGEPAAEAGDRVA